jgi:hypothetical protein
VVRDALALTEAGRSKEAYDMLEPLEVTRAGDPDFDTVFGIAANQSGQHVRAVMALERATNAQPGNARARAELGRAMFSVGDSQSARKLLEDAKAGGAPPEAAYTIDQFLRAIDVAEALVVSSWKGYVEGSIGHDSNISSGPSNANVAVPALGGNVTLGPNSVSKSANVASVGAGLSGRYVIDTRWSLIGNGSFGYRDNMGASRFNNGQFDIGGGASYRVDRQEYSLVAVHQDYNVDGGTNRTQNGLVGEWVYRMDYTRELGAYLQYSKLHYPGQTMRDTHRTVLGGSYAQRLDQDWLAWGGAYLGKEDEIANGVPQYGHSLAGLRLGVQKSIDSSLSGFAALNYENRRYGGPDPFFLVKRHDNQASLSLGLSWIPASSWRVTPQLSYVRSQSNIVINDYDRTTLSVAARYEF